MSRRGLFKTVWAAAGTAALARFPAEVEAHYLRPSDPAYQFSKYEGIVDRKVKVRQLYAWSNIQNQAIYANIRNGLNGFQFSYDIPADQIQVVVQAYSSANSAMYDDHVWEKYKLGKAYNVKDPATDKPATRNVWYKSKLSTHEVSPPPKDQTHPYYLEESIEDAQRRGVLFLI